MRHLTFLSLNFSFVNGDINALALTQSVLKITLDQVNEVNQKFIYVLLLLVCMCVHAFIVCMARHAITLMWESEDSSVALTISF